MALVIGDSTESGGGEGEGGDGDWFSRGMVTSGERWLRIFCRYF